MALNEEQLECTHRSKIASPAEAALHCVKCGLIFPMPDDWIEEDITVRVRIFGKLHQLNRTMDDLHRAMQHVLPDVTIIRANGEEHRFDPVIWDGNPPPGYHAEEDVKDQTSLAGGPFPAATNEGKA